MPKVFPQEFQFCQILWEHEPVPSTKLVALCKEKLGWSKSTTYTVIRRLVNRGVIKNESAICTSVLTKNQIQISAIRNMVDEYFNGDIKQLRETMDIEL